MEKSLRGPALSKAVRDYVKEYILDHKLKGGDSLPPETKLAEQLGVGRSSVREAVKALQSLGIVEVRHGHGLFVREYNLDPILETLSFGLRSGPARLAELMQIRIWLETAAIREAVDRIGAAELSDLHKLMQVWEERLLAAKAPFASDFAADLDEQFHRQLYGTLNNHTLAKLFEVFWIAFTDMELPVPEDIDPWETYHNHKAILTAVADKDVALSGELLVAHFGHLRERIRLAWEQHAAVNSP